MNGAPPCIGDAAQLTVGGALSNYPLFLDGVPTADLWGSRAPQKKTGPFFVRRVLPVKLCTEQH